MRLAMCAGAVCCAIGVRSALGGEILRIDGEGTPDANGPTPVWPMPGSQESLDVSAGAIGVNLIDGADVVFDDDGVSRILRQRIGETMSLRLHAPGQPFTKDPKRQAYGISVKVTARQVGDIAAGVSGTCLTLSNGAGHLITMEMDSRHFFDRRGIALRRPGTSGQGFSPLSESLVQQRHSAYEIPAIPLDREMLLEVFVTRHSAQGNVLVRLNGSTLHHLFNLDSGSDANHGFDAGNSWKLNLPVIGGVRWEIRPPLAAWDEVHDEAPHWWKDAGPEHELKAVFQPQIMHGQGLGDYDHVTTGDVEVHIEAIKGRNFPHQDWLVGEASGAGSHAATTRHEFGDLPFSSHGDASIVLGKDIYLTGQSAIEMKAHPLGGGAPIVHLKLDSEYVLRDMLNGGAALNQLHAASRVTIHAVLSSDGSVRVLTTDQTVGSNEQTIFSAVASPWVVQPVGTLSIAGTADAAGCVFAWGFQSIQSWITLPVNSSMVTALGQNSAEPSVEVDYHSGGNIGKFLNFIPSVSSIAGGWYPGLAEGFRHEAVTSFTGRAGQRFELWFQNNFESGGLEHVRGVRLLMMDGCAVNGFNQMTNPHSSTEGQMLVEQHKARLQEVIDTLTARGNRALVTTMVPRTYFDVHTSWQQYWTCKLNEYVGGLNDAGGLVTVSDVESEAMERPTVFVNGAEDLLIGGDGVHPTGLPGKFGGSTGAHDWFMLTYLGERAPDGQSIECVAPPIPLGVPCWAVDCAPEAPNGVISVADISATISRFGQNTGTCDNSPNNGDGSFGDGVITIADIIAVITHFGEVCAD